VGPDSSGSRAQPLALRSGTSSSAGAYIRATGDAHQARDPHRRPRAQLGLEAEQLAQLDRGDVEPLRISATRFPLSRSLSLERGPAPPRRRLGQVSRRLDHQPTAGADSASGTRTKCRACQRIALRELEGGGRVASPSAIVPIRSPAAAALSTTYRRPGASADCTPITSISD